MICKSCMKNPASVKFTEVVDGKVMKHYLCPECYKTLREKSSGFTLSVPKPSLRNPEIEDTDSPKDKTELARCPSCGATASQLLESATAGCTTCYDAFDREIKELLKGFQPGLMYRGKIFKCDDKRLQASKEIQEKRILLRHMIKEENYEEAARLRDEIARMEVSVQAPETEG